MKEGIWKLVLSIFVLLLGGERVYEYSTSSDAFGASPPSAESKESKESEEHVEKGTWLCTVTYEVTEKVKAAKGAFPDGYLSTYLYTHNGKIRWIEERRPDLEDITFRPAALAGKDVKVYFMECAKAGAVK